MNTTDIGYIALCAGLLLLIIPVYFLWRYRTGLVKAILVSTVRMVVQLFLIGIYLKYLFLWNNPWINALWVVIMVLVAAQTAVKRTRLKSKMLFVPIAVGLLVSAVLIGFYFLGIVLQLDNVFSAQYFIPIFGIIMGNMLSVDVVALNTYYTGLNREQQMYYFLLGNGATRFEATAPFMRAAIVKAFSPCIANMAVMGLVALPGTMIGQILGGSSPNVAIKYQMMIIVITCTASMLSLIITVALSSRSTFDAYGRFKQVLRDE
jgi:putative ABC transport system permease protein